MATLVVRDPILCTGPGGLHNFSTAYVMSHSADGLGWAQAGFWRSGQGLQHYLQYARRYPYGFNTQVSSLISPNVAWTYKVQYNGSCSCMQFYWGSSRVDADTDWNQFHIGNWTYPFTIEVPGEVLYRDSTFPGLNATRMTATAIKGQYSDAFGNVPCGSFAAVNQGLNSHISSMYDNCKAYDLWNG